MSLLLFFPHSASPPAPFLLLKDTCRSCYGECPRVVPSVPFPYSARGPLWLRGSQSSRPWRARARAAPCSSPAALGPQQGARRTVSVHVCARACVPGSVPGTRVRGAGQAGLRREGPCCGSGSSCPGPALPASSLPCPSRACHGTGSLSRPSQASWPPLLAGSGGGEE